MQKIDIPVFKGMAPRVSPALLENSQGVYVVGECTSGELRPWRTPVHVEDCDSTTRGIFLTATEDWLTFDQRVSVCSAPQAQDAFGRVYYTKEDGGLFVAANTDGYEEFLAGVPIPSALPVVEVTGGGSGDIEDRVYCYTFVNDWGEESAPSDPSESVEYQSDQTISIGGFSVPDTGYKLVVTIRLYRLAVGDTGAEWMFVDEFAAGTYGLNTLLNSDHWTASGSGTAEYYYTGDVPAAAPDKFAVETAEITKGAVGTLTAGTWAWGDNDTLGADTFYIRLMDGGDPDAEDEGVFTYWDMYQDAIPDAALGEVLSTEDYDLPLSGSRGLAALGGGVLAAYNGNEIAFCEPFLPYAWPDKYRTTVFGNIVALGVTLGGMVVLTDSSSYWIGTSHPSAAQLAPDEYANIPMGEATPCLSPYGVVSTEFGVMFPAHDGLRVIAGGQPSKLLTTELLTKKEWASLYDPVNILAAYYDGTYYAFHGTAGFAYNLRTNVLTWCGLAADAVHTDSLGLYIALGGSILEWEGGTGLMRATFKSRVFRYPAPVNFSAVRVDSAASDFWERFASFVLEIMAMNEATTREVLALVDEGLLAYSVAGDNLLDLPYGGEDIANLRLKVWADGELVVDMDLPEGGFARLPGGFLAREWQAQISSSVHIKQLAMGTSMRAVKA